MNDAKDTLATVGAIALAVVCCALPLLIIGGVGILGGIAWGKVALVIGSAVVLVLAAQRAVGSTRRRRGA